MSDEVRFIVYIHDKSPLLVPHEIQDRLYEKGFTMLSYASFMGIAQCSKDVFEKECKLTLTRNGKHWHSTASPSVPRGLDGIVREVELDGDYVIGSGIYR